MEKAVGAFHTLIVTTILLIFYSAIELTMGNRGSTVVKVLCYKMEGCWFDPSWCHWNFSLA